MSKNTEFRTCPTTGLKVDLAAEKLIKANAVAAVIFLAIGGLFGLLVALTRWPEVHLLPADWFYLALTAHGFDVLLVHVCTCAEPVSGHGQRSPRAVSSPERPGRQP